VALSFDSGDALPVSHLVVTLHPLLVLEVIATTSWTFGPLSLVYERFAVGEFMMAF
jgi:hypothetical protein